MPTRTARTAWNGTLQEGSGQVELSSSKVGTYEVSFPRRAADEAGGYTSPEELIAAAHRPATPWRCRRRSARPAARRSPWRCRPTCPSALTRPAVSGSPASSSPSAARSMAWTPRRLRERRPGGQGRLPGEQGPDRSRHHAGRRARGLSRHPGAGGTTARPARRRRPASPPPSLASQRPAAQVRFLPEIPAEPYVIAGEA